MSLSNGGITLARRIARQAELPVAILPAFLCPGILKSPIRPTAIATKPRCQPPRRLHNSAVSQAKSDKNPLFSRPLASGLEPTLTSKLPVQCPGCGAFSQVVEKGDPGFYTLSRRSLKEHFQTVSSSQSAKERDMFENAVSKLDALQSATDESKSIVGDLSSAFAETSDLNKQSEPPVCDRCHKLKHHQTGVSIHHPSVQSIQDTIFESPYKYNHIYHIVDAADFPMSLVQGLHRLLHLTPQRSLNRRSQTGKYYHGRKTEVSFIITRSDLLGPTKEHVDKLMPYLRSVLRDALGKVAQDSRLGNLRCVSAKRQWWTKELREEIWQRGGGGWMVGKVNVGKSQLFHEVFPKGRMGEWGKHTTVSTAMNHIRSPQPVKEVAETDPVEPLEVPVELIAAEPATEASDPILDYRETGSKALVEDAAETPEHISVLDQNDDLREEVDLIETTDSSVSDPADELGPSTEPLDPSSLLPPLPIETPYPVMPLVSSLPGTTASPIRVPFGNGKGELIDLPGLSRSDLEQHVEPHHRASLVMTARIEPYQHVMKPGSSLLIGGFIRITPTTPNLHVLAYNFTRLTDHQTSTAKAIGVQTRTGTTSTENISLPGTEDVIASAGKFYLKYDVTKARTGPLTRNDAAAISPERLPFRVLGTDILIEGVGWIELAAQVRNPRGSSEGDKLDPEALDQQGLIDPMWPEVEIFTPQGKFVGQRRPMNAWVMNVGRPGKSRVKARPRKAMKGMKKVEKMRAKALRSLHPL